MPVAVARELREIGARIETERTAGIYAALQPDGREAGIRIERDLAYGPHERQVLDVFAAKAAPGGHAVVVFVHGGGFTRGQKSAPGSPFYDNVMFWAVHQGLVGVNINYRLAPAAQWPSGIEDLGRVNDWIHAHIADYGGDPGKVFFWGHSAGAAHVGDYIADRTGRGEPTGLAGAILTSGFYRLGDEVSIGQSYYGDDVSQYAGRSSFDRLVAADLPLFVNDAELDPEPFGPESRALVEARRARGKPVCYVHLPGHSHISETYAVGTPDESLSGPVLEFIHQNL
jgi:acetyl esterase/lipase